MLRENGDPDEAARVQAGPLSEMIAALRMPVDTDESLAARVESILAAEAERVADAAVLAELLAPLLQRPSSHALASPAVTPVRTPPPPVPLARGAAGDIADFIDEMIAQENAAPDGRPRRRAS